uniref:HOOK N-terminal domain-containing protein n=1 Tax=Bionectria ochroleuca TaxID=29856 RepID=A0A8H7NM51_BIOOC
MVPPAGKTAVSYSHGAQTALLNAVNRMFELGRTVHSLDELNNGVILGQILHELDQDFDPSNLETSQGTSKYLTNKRNIQTIYKGLFRFIRRQIPELGCQAKKVDYHAIAENPDSHGISQLLAVMVSAAAMGPDNKRYIPKIQRSLDRDTQAEIMQILQIVQQDIAASEGDQDLDEAIDAVMEARDMDLLVEEQNAALRQQLEATKKNLSDYITRLEYLQLSHEELRYEKEKNDRELEILRKATQDGANSAESVKVLEAQVHEQMEIIARNEETIRAHERTKAQLESEVQRLTQKSIQADDLRDQVIEWKHKAEELEKKANTADRYKQKLESQQHLVKEVQNLQYEKADLQEQLRSLVDDRERNSRTRQAEDELTKMITQSEQHLWDERSQKNQLIRDVAALEEELMRLKAQRTHDESYIQDLQEQIQHGGATEAPTQGEESLGVEGLSLNLAAELDNASNDGQPLIPLELSRLKAENDLLRRTMGSSGDAALLRRELEDERNQREHLQNNFNEIFEKHTLAQGQIDALMEDKIGEEAQAFRDLRTRSEQLEENLEKAQRRLEQLENVNADQTRELVTVKTQLSAVEKDQTEAIDDLKKTDVLVSESLQGELVRLREKYNFAISERDAHKSQLVEALLEKDRLRKGSEEGKDLDAKDSDGPEISSKGAEKIEKLRERLKERNEQLEKSERDRLDLQRKLKAALGGETAAAEKAATDQLISNLRRENSLMATAWFGLTTRLQSNHVVLQRRHDSPKSWVNKQRQMVNATPRR